MIHQMKMMKYLEAENKLGKNISAKHYGTYQPRRDDHKMIHVILGIMIFKTPKNGELIGRYK